MNPGSLQKELNNGNSKDNENEVIKNETEKKDLREEVKTSFGIKKYKSKK